MSKRGGESNTTNVIVMMAVGFLLVAIFTPIAMDQMLAANTTGWQTSVKTIFTVLVPILYLVSCALWFVPKRS